MKGMAKKMMSIVDRAKMRKDGTNREGGRVSGCGRGWRLIIIAVPTENTHEAT